MGLRGIGASLPPGFRFHPSDEELVCHYLRKKVANEQVDLRGTLVEIDLHTCEPWQLPEVAMLNSNEWYFFSFRDRKYATGYRTNRATISGYWKATGKDRIVRDPRTRAIAGMRKTLVFYQNRAPNGNKTGWIMHEFRHENPHMPPKEDWVLCRVFHKSKGEDSNRSLDPQNVFPNTQAGPTSPYLAPSPATDQTFPSGISSFSRTSSSRQIQNPTSLQNILATNPTFLQFSDQEINNAPITAEINSKSEVDDDQYGFLFGLSFEASSLGDGGPPGLGEMMRFDDDGDSLVFL